MELRTKAQLSLAMLLFPLANDVDGQILDELGHVQGIWVTGPQGAKTCIFPWLYPSTTDTRRQ
jgi:hypothetical protein